MVIRGGYNSDGNILVGVGVGQVWAGDDEMTITKLPFVICCAGMCNGCHVTVRVEPLMALSMNLQLSPGYVLLPLHCLQKS